MLPFPSEFLPKDLPTHSFPKPTKICFWKPILILPLHAFFGIINFIVLWLVYTFHLCLNQEVLTDKLNNMQNSLSALISSTVWNHKWLFSVPFRNLLGSLSPVRGPCVCVCVGVVGEKERLSHICRLWGCYLFLGGIHVRTEPRTGHWT